MLILNPENYCVPGRYQLFGKTTKQTWSNFEPPKPWKHKQLWAVRPEPNCL